jgi:hypothetical protein
MPTRKQRRRHQKERRHEWEYVWVDDEGHEVEVDPEQIDARKNARAERADASTRRNGKAQTAAQRRGARVPPQPSWTRAAKRSAILGVFFVIVFGFLLRSKHTNASVAVLYGVLYAVAFIPLQYFIDRTVYRAYLRRQETKKR